MPKFNSNARIFLVMFLVAIFIAAIALKIGYGGELPDDMKWVEIFFWPQSEFADGYELIVITHYSITDRSIKTEKIHKVGKVESAVIPIYKLSLDIANVCFQITAHAMVEGEYIESKHSDRFCMAPWPPVNLKTK